MVLQFKFNVTSFTGTPEYSISMRDPNNHNNQWYFVPFIPISIGQNTVTLNSGSGNPVYLIPQIRLKSGDTVNVTSYSWSETLSYNTSHSYLFDDTFQYDIYRFFQHLDSGTSNCQGNMVLQFKFNVTSFTGTPQYSISRRDPNDHNNQWAVVDFAPIQVGENTVTFNSDNGNPVYLIPQIQLKSGDTVNITSYTWKQQTQLTNFIIPSTIIEHTIIELNPPQSNNTSGAFTYTSSNTEIATIINNNKLKIIGSGQIIVTSSQSETNNYTSASITAIFNTSVIKFPQLTDILPNQIIGTSEPNSIVVITETTTNNQTISTQIQSNMQGTWNFNVTTNSNQFSFAPLNASQFATSIESNYSMKYPHKKYTLTTNTPVLIKPRQNGVNIQDQRFWRISPKLPEGLKFSCVSGIISGTPVEPLPSTIYNIWSISEVFLSYKKQVTIEIVSSE